MLKDPREAPDVLSTINMQGKDGYLQPRTGPITGPHRGEF